MIRSAPRWVWWTAGTVFVWALWAMFVAAPLERRNAALDPQGAELDREIQTMNARMMAVPLVLSRLDSARVRLAARLDAYVPVDRVESLIAELTRAGHTQGLAGIRVQPDLEHLLDITSPQHVGGTGFHVDTLPFTIGGQGRFAAIGQWIEQMESRPDFREWQHGHWSSFDDGLTMVEMRGSFLLVNRSTASPEAAVETEVAP